MSRMRFGATDAVSADGNVPHQCRFCSAPLERTFVDLGMSPLCESFVSPERVETMEPFYPLHVRICDSCGLVQLPALATPEELFTTYAYFSSYSTSWVEHARTYVEMIVARLELGPDDFVVELASNDGYLLQHLIGKNIPFIGVEPAGNVAEAAEERGVPTRTVFFGVETAQELVRSEGRATLVVGNNVLAQVPDLHDFVGGVSILLAERGTATFEFPHLMRLVQAVQYDTIYHEHFSYFSLATVEKILAAHGLEVYDVEELTTHGGSLRVYAQHAGGPHATTASVDRVLVEERSTDVETFAAAVEQSKWGLIDLLVGIRREGRTIAGYGAPGKANTLLNYCGIRTDLVQYIVDRNPYKQGRFTPGTHIPILPPSLIEETKPDYVVVLPWNLFDEIAAQLSYITSWGGRLIVPVPSAQVVGLTTTAPDETAATEGSVTQG